MTSQGLTINTVSGQKAMRLDASGNLGIGTITPGTVSIGKAVITEDIGLLTTVYANPHPALIDACVAHLLKMADSEHRQDRLAAVSHRLMPTAKVVMMQDDKDDEVSAIAWMILEHELENERGSNND